MVFGLNRSRNIYSSNQIENALLLASVFQFDLPFRETLPLYYLNTKTPRIATKTLINMPSDHLRLEYSQKLTSVSSACGATTQRALALHQSLRKPGNLIAFACKNNFQKAFFQLSNAPTELLALTSFAALKKH